MAGACTVQLRGVSPTGPQREAIDRILGLDLEPIVFTLTTSRYGEPAQMTLDQADQAVRWYRVYLILIVLFPEQMLVPPRPADEVWHTHALDNGKYNEEMLAIFGFILIHFPYLGMRGGADVARWTHASLETRRLYLEVAGIDLAGVADGGACTVQMAACSDSQCDHGGSGCFGYTLGGDDVRPRPVREVAAA